jgi:hypothetical protein
LPIEAFLEPNPAYKPETDNDKAAYASIVDLHKKNGAIRTDLAGIVEAIRNSKGMYRQRVEAPAPVDATIKVPSMAERSIEELKAMALTMGIDITRKQRMTKADLVKLVETKLRNVQIVDETNVPIGDQAEEAPDSAE